MIKRFGYTLKQAFQQLFRNRAMSLASIVAIMAMLLILGLFFILVVNINAAAQSIQQDYDSIEIYLLDDTSKKDAEKIIDDMEGQYGVDEAYYKTKAEAMDDLKDQWGDNGYLLDSLENNPLPNSVVIKIADLEAADDLAAKAETYDGVEDVKFYKSTVDKLLQITNFIQIGAIVIMIFLIVVAIVVVSNTIKLTVFNRSSEISIMKYVGATNWFIRGPFLAEGIIIGIISAGVSLGLLAFVYKELVDMIGEQVFSMLSMPMIPLSFIVYNFIWIFLALGISIGSCGSIISMRRFLDA